jgi:hypothetical protein
MLFMSKRLAVLTCGPHVQKSKGLEAVRKIRSPTHLSPSQHPDSPKSLLDIKIGKVDPTKYLRKTFAAIVETDVRAVYASIKLGKH